MEKFVILWKKYKKTLFFSEKLLNWIVLKYNKKIIQNQELLNNFLKNKYSYFKGAVSFVFPKKFYEIVLAIFGSNTKCKNFYNYDLEALCISNGRNSLISFKCII